jgi:hypothetical protein
MNTGHNPHDVRDSGALSGDWEIAETKFLDKSDSCCTRRGQVKLSIYLCDG